MRCQLRAGVVTNVLLALLLGTFPVVLRLVADSGTRADVPLFVWIVMGVAPYPVLLLMGRWYVRRAESNEIDFAKSHVTGSAVTERP
ncbi:hypothetical protein [Streptomyces sp. NPDC005125]